MLLPAQKSGPSETPEEQSKKAMENLTSKLEVGNYSVVTPNLTTNVEAAGFPTVDITTASVINAKNHIKFEYLYNSNICTYAYRNTFYLEDNNGAIKFIRQYKQALTLADFEPVEETPYLKKDNLVFQPNDAAGGMVGLYFFIE